jgi:hypothetical protein
MPRNPLIGNFILYLTQGNVLVLPCFMSSVGQEVLFLHSLHGFDFSALQFLQLSILLTHFCKFFNLQPIC